MKIITIVGARPQFIKAAMVSKAIINFNQNEGYEAIQECILHSGQHYDENMSKIFFEELDIPKPKWILDGKDKTITQIKNLIYPILKEEHPQYILVYGDTKTTLAGALAAEKANIKIIHIEAGLRSFNNAMPEEYNRIETDKRSYMLFCPTSTAKHNLLKERITKNIFQCGDVMYDASIFFSKIASCKSNILNVLNIKPKQFNLVTIHRAENTDLINRLKEIFIALNEISTYQNPSILPIHPRTKLIISNCSFIKEIICKNQHIRIIEPVSFIDMISLENNAYKILTDSGGIQKEAYFHKTPCITLREETEWMETVNAGWNQIAGYKHEEIIKCYKKNPLTSTIDEYGEGNAAKKIIELIWGKKF